MGIEILIGAAVAAGVSWLLNRKQVKKHVPAAVAKAIQDSVPGLVTDAVSRHMDEHHKAAPLPRPPSRPGLGKK